MACRNNAALFNMSYFGKYYLTGPDAQTAADWIFSNNMRKSIGATVYTCMLNERGGTEADLTVSMIEPGDDREAFAPNFNGKLLSFTKARQVSFSSYHMPYDLVTGISYRPPSGCTHYTCTPPPTSLSN